MKKVLLAGLLFSTSLLHATETSQIGVEKITACTACHGEQGISNHAEWPSLAGQHASYLRKQLHDFKKGTTRNVPAMTAIVANLNARDIAELANFYAKLPLPTGTTPANYLKRGEQLYRGGDFSQQITACIACHGPNGRGNAEAGFPVLSGQHAPYTIQQLQAFKDNKRTNDLNSIMRDISARMTPEDMNAVAYYIQGLY